jgi:hypothetical protein
MRVKVTNICSEDVLPTLRSLANELEARMSVAADGVYIDVDQIRFNTVSVSDDEIANSKFAKANETYGRFKDKGVWHTELSLALVFDPREVDATRDGEMLRAWVHKMEVQLLTQAKLPGGIDPEPVVALVRGALREPS